VIVGRFAEQKRTCRPASESKVSMSYFPASELARDAETGDSHGLEFGNSPPKMTSSSPGRTWPQSARVRASITASAACARRPPLRTSRRLK